MKLRTATESVGTMNSEGPLNQSPRFPSPTEETIAALQQRITALEAEKDISNRYAGEYSKEIIEVRRRMLALQQQVAQMEKQIGWTCAARRAATDPPQGCDWPMCGCDSHADKVIAALQESGRLDDVELLQQQRDHFERRWSEMSIELGEQVRRAEAAEARCVALQAEKEQLLGLCQRLHRAFDDYVDWHGAVHDEDCPADDTCGCSGRPVNDLVNAALTDLERLLDPPAQTGGQ